MGTTFNNAKPFLDAESAELRMNFVHQSIATNGIALVIRKTPAKIRLEKEKLLAEDYFTPAVHDLLIQCVKGHCNIMVAGETGSGKTEFVKYLASHTITSEKLITIEDTLELHLDKIYPQRDIVSMKTNNVASYSDVLVTCMRQNPKWILLSEVRSAEAVSAVRNSISSGHNILSTIHADKASAIPYRLYSLMETDLDVTQFLTTIYRYIQLGVHIKAFYSKQYGKFHRELDEVCEFYVDDNNEPKSRIIYQKLMGKMIMCKPSKHLQEYLSNQNIDIEDIIKDLPEELPIVEMRDGEATVIDPNDPGAKPDVEEEKEEKSGPEVGETASIPIIGEDGNVKLSDNVIKKDESSVDTSQNNPASQTVAQTSEVPGQTEVPTTPQPQIVSATPTPSAPPIQNNPLPNGPQPTNVIPQPAQQQGAVQANVISPEQVQAAAVPQQAPAAVQAATPQPAQAPAASIPQAATISVNAAQQPAPASATQAANVVPNLVRLDG